MHIFTHYQYCMRRVVGFAPQPLYPMRKRSGTYWMGGLVDCRSCLDVLGMKKISCSCRESNQAASLVTAPTTISQLNAVRFQYIVWQLQFCVRVKVTAKLWIVPHNLQALAAHLAVTDQAHRLDRSVLTKVTVAHKATREWAGRTVSLSCAVLTPVFICHKGLLSGQEACCRLYHCFNRLYAESRLVVRELFGN